jgi:hypothetical protein
MENNSKSAEDLRTIRKIMEESTRFLSLSGLSGIFAGAIAITGALIAWFFILKNGTVNIDKQVINLSEQEIISIKWKMIAVALSVLILSILFSLYFSVRKAKREGKELWSHSSKRLLVNLMIPLITGAVFTVVLLIHNHTELIVPELLIFYGLALVNAGKFTYGEIFYLGILEIITGLTSSFFPGQGLIFWIIGFGILHIIYGLAMYRKYEA